MVIVKGDCYGEVAMMVFSMSGLEFEVRKNWPQWGAECKRRFKCICFC